MLAVGAWLMGMGAVGFYFAGMGKLVGRIPPPKRRSAGSARAESLVRMTPTLLRYSPIPLVVGAVLVVVAVA